MEKNRSLKSRFLKHSIMKQPVWGENETKLYEAVVKTQDLNVLNPLFVSLKEPNAFHLWKDVSLIKSFM